MLRCWILGHRWVRLAEEEWREDADFGVVYACSCCGKNYWTRGGLVRDPETARLDRARGHRGFA